MSGSILQMLIPRVSTVDSGSSLPVLLTLASSNSQLLRTLMAHDFEESSL